MRPQELHCRASLILITNPARMTKFNSDRCARQPLLQTGEVIEVARVRDKVWRELESDHSELAGAVQWTHRAPEHPKSHLQNLSRGSCKLPLFSLRSWQHLAQILRQSRNLRRMLRHEPEGLDVEKKSVGRTLRPKSRIAFCGQHVIRRINLDRIEVFRIEPQSILGCAR